MASSRKCYCRIHSGTGQEKSTKPRRSRTKLELESSNRPFLKASFRILEVFNCRKVDNRTAATSMKVATAQRPRTVQPLSSTRVGTATKR